MTDRPVRGCREASCGSRGVSLGMEAANTFFEIIGQKEKMGEESDVQCQWERWGERQTDRQGRRRWK